MSTLAPPILETTVRKALAKRTRKSAQVLDLRFVWPLICIDLRRLAWTCVDFGRVQIWTQVDSSFFTVWPPSASRHKLIPSNLLLWKRINQLYAWNLRLFATCEPTCESVWPPFASPYASSGFANLRWLASTCESVWPGLKHSKQTFPSSIACKRNPKL